MLTRGTAAGYPHADCTAARSRGSQVADTPTLVLLRVSAVRAPWSTVDAAAVYLCPDQLAHLFTRPRGWRLRGTRPRPALRRRRRLAGFFAAARGSSRGRAGSRAPQAQI